jgi:hypothetical protein
MRKRYTREITKGRIVCRLYLWSCFQTIKQYAEEGEFDAASIVIAILIMVLAI